MFAAAGCRVLSTGCGLGVVCRLERGGRWASVETASISSGTTPVAMACLPHAPRSIAMKPSCSKSRSYVSTSPMPRSRHTTIDMQSVML